VKDRYGKAACRSEHHDGGEMALNSVRSCASERALVVERPQ
jgi:hypothetical protein